MPVLFGESVAGEVVWPILLSKRANNCYGKPSKHFEMRMYK